MNYSPVNDAYAPRSGTPSSCLQCGSPLIEREGGMECGTCGLPLSSTEPQPVAAPPKSRQQIHEETINRLEKENARLKREVAELRQTNAELLVRVNALEDAATSPTHASSEDSTPVASSPATRDEAVGVAAGGRRSKRES